MNTKLALAAAGATILVLVVVAVSRTHHTATPDNPVHPGGSSRPAAPATTGAPTSLTAGDAEGLLPFTPSQISDAANLATTFAATYTSHRHDETPSAYLTRLTPMISPQLRPIIERAANDPATLNQRRRLQQITTAQAHPEAIRALGPSSITFLITVTEHVATAHANRNDTLHYALTLTQTGGEWQVYAIELAATGNTGEHTATPDHTP
jgi:hypothetical protein